MNRRIMAWAVLVGFIVLLVDILFTGYMRSLSAPLYVILVLTFILFGMRNKNR